MRVVVTGATGYIGRASLTRLLLDNNEVLAVARARNADRLPKQTDMLRTLVTADGRISADQLSGYDSVIHLAGRAHTQATENGRDSFDEANRLFALQTAAAALHAGVKRFVLVSSIGVHGHWSETPVNESSALVPDTPYARSKIAAEEAVAHLCADSPMALCIVRPPMVYGPLCPGNFPRLVKLVHRPIPLPFANVSAIRSFIHVDNLADFLALCASQAQDRHTHVIGDGSDWALPDLIRRIAMGIGKKPCLIPFPINLLRTLAKVVGYDREIASLTRPMAVDWSQARMITGWQPKLAPQLALDRTLRAFAEVAPA